MLRDAGLPLAMGNAIDDVKAASEYIMPDCDHDGVAEAIERFLLGAALTRRAKRCMIKRGRLRPDFIGGGVHG